MVLKFQACPDVPGSETSGKKNLKKNLKKLILILSSFTKFFENHQMVFLCNYNCLLSLKTARSLFQFECFLNYNDTISGFESVPLFIRPRIKHLQIIKTFS